MKETLCWSCEKCTNENLCSWAAGEPVDGWTAVETVIKEDKYAPSKSYNVIECPNYKESPIVEISVNELAEIIGVNRRTIFRYIADPKHEKINKKLGDKGFELVIYDEETNNTYALRRKI